MNMLWFLLILMPFIMPFTARGQEWQAYQITHYDQGQIRYCRTLQDAEGNLHTYFSLETDHANHVVYYIRVSPYGQILTDTTRLNLHPHSYDLSVEGVGNGVDHTWGLWTESIDTTANDPALYLAGRDENGSETMPPTMVHQCYDTGEAAYRNSDSTIHFFTGRYYRISTSGEPLIWGVQVPESRPSAHVNFAVAPSGTPWGMLRYDEGQTADLALVRFNEDATCTVHYPFGYEQELRWGLYDFAIDAQDRFHCLVAVDTCHLAYALLDTSMVLLEWHPLLRNYGTASAIGVDSSGNSLMVWWVSTDELLWAYRTVDGTWTTEGNVVVDSVSDAIHHFSVIGSGQSRWAITCLADAANVSDQANIRLFTYGFPPNSSPKPPRGVFANDLRIYPNPFNSTATLTFALRTPVGVDLALYDLLGRRVLTLAHDIRSAGEYRIAVDGTRLPSGVYVVSMRAGDVVNAQKLLLLK